MQSGDNLVGFLAQGYGTLGVQRDPRRHVRPGGGELDEHGARHRLDFNTTATGTNHASHEDDDRSVRQRRHRHDGAVGEPWRWSGTETCRFRSDVFQRRVLCGVRGATARGTAAAPAAVQLGDPLGFFGGNGYGTTDFGEAGGMVVIAAENWTDTAQGRLVAFTTTPLGSTTRRRRMAILPDGNVGIGTFTDIPTITDKLQVFGDIRVGTTGTERLPQELRRHRPRRHLRVRSALQERHHAVRPCSISSRRCSRCTTSGARRTFPQQHFGDSRAYGLIAQDVEQVLPELVVTNDDGFKAVDYSKLPLLTIQAVKELKAENDALKQRVAELERLVKRRSSPQLASPMTRALKDAAASSRPARCI